MTQPDRFADLHLHSNCSDGSDPPAEVVARAAALGFAAIALTDHDTVAGLAEAAQAARPHNIELITGIEISSGIRGQEVHVLGYGIDPEHAELQDTLARLHRQRQDRVVRIVQRLQELDLPIDLEAVRARGRGAIGRVHVAQELRDQGYASSVQNAFDRYLKGGRPAYVPKPLLPTPEAIALIQSAGGAAFLAHPGLSRQGKRLGKLLELPFDGIEVYHTDHTPEQTARYARLAHDTGRLISGGSDCHGAAKGKPPEMGRIKLPYEHVARITARTANAPHVPPAVQEP